jgi:hypothetical protein
MVCDSLLLAHILLHIFLDNDANSKTVVYAQRSLTPDEFKHTHLVAESLVNSFGDDDVCSSFLQSVLFLLLGGCWWIQGTQCSSILQSATETGSNELW